MIRFLIKGILRDPNRSVLPVLVISIGVFLSVLFSAWFSGVFSDMIRLNANFSTGHLKVMTRAYAENAEQMPNDLALLETGSLVADLQRQFPQLDWTQRIRFGGLLDVADAEGNTRAQGMAAGYAVDLFSPGSREAERMNIMPAIVEGRLPAQPGEALISDDFARRFKVGLGDTVTLFGSTMDGGMSFANFAVAGTVRFGMPVLDRGAIIVDITDAQSALDMQDAAGEVLGFFKSDQYEEAAALEVKTAFNARFQNDDDEFAPLMQRLNDQNGLEEYLVLSKSMSGIMIFVFIFAMSIVLWNTGLLGGLRRYNEFGIRLAMGEEKKRLFRSLIIESVVIGLAGSVLGTALGLSAAYYLQETGLDFGSAVQGGSMMMPTVFRAHIGAQTFYIGFIPGLFSMVLGNALSGLGIYRRKTAELFKELSV
ncbi:MAG TPA: FtsX-like permease family protein, partial [Saprospiraceae bacterium]|nr:FtsX-like permease family protein [Saprospiraceae bacterium]